MIGASYGVIEMAEQLTPTTRRPAAPGHDRFLLAIVAGALLLVVVGVVVVVPFGRPRPAPPADPSSPAGVVQQYVEAVRAGDLERARGYLTREARAQVEARDRSSPYRPSVDDNARIVVDTVSTTDTTAEVKVAISRFYARSNPFSSSTSHYDVPVRLIREDGAWRISQPVDPYPFY
jgi:hypothetical protein